MHVFKCCLTIITIVFIVYIPIIIFHQNYSYTNKKNRATKPNSQKFKTNLHIYYYYYYSIENRKYSKNKKKIKKQKTKTQNKNNIKLEFQTIFNIAKHYWQDQINNQNTNQKTKHQINKLSIKFKPNQIPIKTTNNQKQNTFPLSSPFYIFFFSFCSYDLHINTKWKLNISIIM